MNAMPTTGILDSSGPDLMHILKQMADEICDQSISNSLHEDSEVRDFMALLCQHIHAGNILTPVEVSEYEAMVEAGEVRYGKELDASSELFPDILQEIEVEDNCFLTEEIEMADSHISTVTQLQKTLNDEMQHVSSGIQQLEKQEKAAYDSLLAEEQQCIKLVSRVSSAQEELLKWLQCLAKLPAELKNKSATWLISQLPLDSYRKQCCQFDHSIKVMMKQCLEWNEYSGEEYEDDLLEELEESFTEMKLEYVCMLADDQGKKFAIEMLKDIMSDIQTSKLTVSFNEIKSQSLLLEEKVNAGKKQVSLVLENEALPAVEEAVKMDVFQIRKYKNEHKLCRLERILKQNERLDRCLETGLLDSELLLLLLICERQKLVDMTALYQQCHQEIREQYLECTSRVEIMQQLRENKSSNSVIMENPLVQCLVQLFCDEQSVNTFKSVHELMLHVKKLNKDITSQEEKLFDCLFEKHRSFCIQNKNAIKTAEKFLCSGLINRPPLLMQISTCCSNSEQLLESFQAMLKRIEDNYKGKQVSLLQKPFHKEQRLLWLYFLMDPKKLAALYEQLQELTEKRISYMLQHHKTKKRYASFFPQRMQK